MIMLRFRLGINLRPRYEKRSEQAVLGGKETRAVILQIHFRIPLDVVREQPLPSPVVFWMLSLNFRYLSDHS